MGESSDFSFLVGFPFTAKSAAKRLDAFSESHNVIRPNWYDRFGLLRTGQEEGDSDSARQSDLKSPPKNAIKSR